MPKKEFRPKSWKNPYLVEDWRGDFYNQYPEFEVFEAGASAMLEAIRAQIDSKYVEAYGSQCGSCNFLFNDEEERDADTVE